MSAPSFNPSKPSSSASAFDVQALPYAVLEHLGVLKVQGKDAGSFLQNQLTQDVASLRNGELRLAGYCSPKGRLLATFWVIRQDQPAAPKAGPTEDSSPPAEDAEAVADEPAFWLLCARDIAASIAKRLSMYVLRAKVRVEDVSARHLLLGFVGTLDDALAPLPGAHEGVIAAAMPDVQLAPTTEALLTTTARRRIGAEHRLSRCLLIVPPEVLAERAADDGMLHYRYAPNDWQQLEVASGVPWISAPIQELFVPQMVNLDLVDGVSFKKGCYPGQEIVARSKYLGKQKRRMFTGLCSGQLPLPGTDVLAYDGTPIGLVVQAVSLSGGREHEVAQRIERSDGDGPVEPLELSCKRYLLLFEARIDAIGIPLQGPGMIATSMLIGDAAIGLLQLPYPFPDV